MLIDDCKTLRELDLVTQAILKSPGTRFVVSSTIRSLLDKDCVDAANDASLINALFSKRCDLMLAN
jgi:hypothetical protein